MFVKRINADYWEGNIDYGLPVDNPDFGMIETAIKNMDGRTKTLVMLETGGEAHMGIGGGDSGYFIVYATFNNEKFYTLFDPSKSEDIRYMVAGGQLGDFKEKVCVGIEAALQAARIFSENGILDQSLNWEESLISSRG